MWEIRLEFDRAFRPGTWIPNALADGVRCRVLFDGSDLVRDIAIRYRKSQTDLPDAIHAYPLDHGIWSVGPCRLHPEMIRCRLILHGVSDSVDYLWRTNL